MSSMARDDVQVNFRMPADLKQQLESAAAASGRTVTAELVQRLQSTFDRQDRPRPVTVEDLQRVAEEMRADLRRLSELAPQPTPKP